jgi:multiple sugar transport system ATP-binding protein
VMLKPVNGAQTGTARVALVEPMGAHLVTWLDARGQSIAVQSAADLDVRPDQVVGFEIDVSKVSVFDAATQRRL